VDNRNCEELILIRWFVVGITNLLETLGEQYRSWSYCWW